jgi:CO/xanthine dehydrogenase Mo-binding subunit
MIGEPVLRTDGRPKVLGTALYTGDLDLPGMLHGVTVRSPVPRGRLRGWELTGDLPWAEFVVVSAADIPGENRVASLVADQPFLADGEIRHREEPVLLLAHADRDLLERARRAVRLDIQELPAVLDLEAALAQADPPFHKAIDILKGDPEGVWGEAALVVDQVYRTGHQEQAYLETQGMLVEPLEGGIQVRGSMQCPYYVHRALVNLLALGDDRVRVIQQETGGGFGGKEEYPSLLAGHAALLALKAGRPVRMLYDRMEDMRATTKRHPSRTRIRSAMDAEGHLLALDIDYALDGGAYATMSPVVLSRGALHASGPYRCPHVRIRARAHLTNTPPNGAFRGFGAPQALFAIERHMDVCAARLGLDPVELRRRNVLRMGDATATGQVIREPLDLPGLMDAALSKLGPPNPGQGRGLSLFMHGAGFTGSGESYLASVAGLEGTPEGRVRILAASTELGQGKDTVFSQIVAGILDLPMDLIEVARPDTARVPNSGPTVASRSTMIVGRLLEEAALSFRQQLVQQGLLRLPATPEAFSTAVRRALAEGGDLRAYSQYHHPPHIQWDDKTYRGDAYPTFSWGCHAVDLSVDPVTYETKLHRFVAVHEVGRVINPVLAAGQVEGGVAQGIGYTLLEEVVMRGGVMANARFTDYIIPTSLDLPPIDVIFVDNPHPGGPGGAKGLGELPMDGPAPAILNALAQVLPGLRLDEVPMTPERLLARLEEAPHA